YEVQGNTLRLNASRSMTWNEEASAALFIVSLKSSLTGGDLPVNGTVYADKSIIGSSVFVTTGSYSNFYNRNHFQNGDVENLASDTRYYIYAFPYVTENCLGGPIYNTTNIPSQSFRTYYKAPASLRVGTLTDTSAELQITVDAAATRYLLAFDTLQLDPQTDMKLDETLTYAAGDEITIGERKLRVLEPCSDASSYILRGLQQGKDYYCYAWSVNAERDWYSRGAASCGVAPVRALPATIDFASAVPVGLKAESWNLPAGWDEESGNSYNYVLREDTSDNKNIKLLSVQNTYEPDSSVSHSVILSPYVDMGEGGSVKATVELVYWAQSGNEMVTAKPKSGDILLVEYQEADGSWCEIASVGASDEVGQDGTYTLFTESFTPKKVFRLRFTVKSSTPTADLESEDRSTPYVGIRTLTLLPSSCKAASNLQVVDGDLSSTGATLKWKDENDVAPLEYSVLYKEATETGWNHFTVTRPSVQLTGLQGAVRIRLWCAPTARTRIVPVPKGLFSRHLRNLRANPPLRSAPPISWLRP
ncbi:MAG: hypothetical protein K2H68_01240, partial [Bacteroidales bacterium]|nr:hypothetical protein [Bacteroidales bacterium]